MSRVRSVPSKQSQADARYRRVVGARLGLLYGVTLLALAFKLSREGRATELVVQLLTAPFGLLVPEVVFTGTVVLWTLLGIGVAMAERAAMRYFVVGVVISHYLVALYAIRVTGASASTSIAAACKTAPLQVAVSLAIYLIGQATIWALLWCTANASPVART